jgi:predicted RNA-binding protein with EMAP domain
MEIIIVLGSLLFISLFVLLTLSVKVRSLKNNVKKLSVAYLKIENLMSSKTKLDNDAHQESFIKFLSDSRDSAFDYIEEVQSGISDFVLQVDPLINYFDEYGDIMGMVPNYDGMKKISVEFKKLKKLLPDEHGKIDI